MLKGERVEPAFRERVWTFAPAGSERVWTGVLLLSGSARIEDSAETRRMAPVSVFLAPSTGERTLRLKAGGEAMLFSLPEALVMAAIGQGPESAEIRRILERPAIIQMADGGRVAEQVEAAFTLLLEESARDAPGQATLMEAGLKFVFGSLLRNLPETEPQTRPLDRSGTLLLRFRQVLERRFRDRWGIAEYARELGISADRLHDLCTAKLGKSPRALVQSRVVYEAQTLLSASSLSVSEIAARLGFRDPAHFSRYFKEARGESPRAYRQSLARPQSAPKPRPDFADWP